MTSRRSSGSSRAESAVEPMRSQNITLSGRRSAVLSDALALLWQFFRFHRYRLRFAFPIRNSYPTDIPRKVSLNCQGSARLGVAADLLPPPPLTASLLEAAGGPLASTPDINDAPRRLTTLLGGRARN